MKNKKFFSLADFNLKNIFIVLIIVINTIVAIAISVGFSQIINQLTGHYKISRIMKTLLFLLILSILEAVLNIYFVQYLPQKLHTYKGVNTTQEVLKLVLKSKTKYFEKKDNGEYFNMGMNSSFIYGGNVIQLNIVLVANVICCLLIFGVSIAVNKWFGLVFLLYIPVYYFSIKRPTLKLSEAEIAVLNEQDKYLNEIKTIVDNKKIINVNHGDDYFIDEYKKIKHRYATLLNKYKFFDVLSNYLPVFISKICQIILVALATYFFYYGDLKVGEILLIYQLSSLFQTPLNECFTTYVNYRSNKIHFKRLNDLAKDSLNSVEYNAQYQDIGSIVEINNANFYSKSDHEQLLFHIDKLEINKGDFILIKGANGSGKSVLMECLSGFFDIDSFEGDIKINKKFQNVAYASYPILLVDGNLQENMLGHQADFELLKVLNINFDDKEIKAGKRNLSFGEQQKLNLLRALSYNSEILILDEPFTNLDASTIKQLTEYLNEIKGTRTIFVIDHGDKLDNIADKVLSIHNKIMFENKQTNC